jgi:import inner membrane translocase subunit TIM10
MAQPTERIMQMAADLEVEMMSDMYRRCVSDRAHQRTGTECVRMSSACQRKCIATHYKESELTKGESVCLDRCVAKYMDVHDRLGKKLTELSQKDEQQAK